MIAIKYYKTIHILVDPNNDSVDNCERYSFLMYPFLDKFNDWWCLIYRCKIYIEKKFYVIIL